MSARWWPVVSVFVALLVSGCAVDLDRSAPTATTTEEVRSTVTITQTPPTVTVTATVRATASPRPVPAGLLADWSFDDSDDEGNRITDDTGHGYYLWEGGDPQKTTSSDARYGRGILFDGVDDSLTSTDERLGIKGDLTIWMVFERASTSHGEELIGYSVLGDEESANALYGIFIRPSGVLHYDHESGSGLKDQTGGWGTNNIEFESSQTVPEGLHVLTARRDVDEGRVLLEIDGQTYIDETFVRDPTGGEDAYFQVGRAPAGPGTPLEGAVYELRIWNEWVSDAELEEA